jgi:hypothetical protein
MAHPVSETATDLHALLNRSEVSEIRALELERIGNLIVLRGVVGSFYYKQLAQELVRKGAEGLEIENLVDVEYVESATTGDCEGIDHASASE